MKIEALLNINYGESKTRNHIQKREVKNREVVFSFRVRLIRKNNKLTLHVFEILSEPLEAYCMKYEEFMRRSSYSDDLPTDEEEVRRIYEYVGAK